MDPNDWTLTGNAGTNPNTNFLGTTDNEPLVIKTNGAEQLRINVAGNIGIGTSSPSARLSVVAPGAVEIIGTARSATLLTSGGGIGSTVGSENALASLGHLVDGANSVSLGIRAVRTSVGVGWTTTAIGLGMDVDNTVRAGASLFLHANKNVGIGTMSPASKLEVAATNEGVFAKIATSNKGNAWVNIGNGTANMNLGVGATTPDPYIYSYSENFFIGADGSPTLYVKGMSNGNVGIGTTTPGEKLTVHGNVSVTGDVILTGADCAEEFDIAEVAETEPGMVVVLDQGGTLHPCQQAYDKRVAGVISGAGDYQPGLILDRRQSQDNRLPVALVGKVFCKVDAEYTPIEVGDLLTTSPTPGHAMKADDPLKAFGAVIGKALKPLEGGQGLIPILIALQ